MGEWNIWTGKGGSPIRKRRPGESLSHFIFITIPQSLSKGDSSKSSFLDPNRSFSGTKIHRDLQFAKALIRTIFNSLRDRTPPVFRSRETIERTFLPPVELGPIISRPKPEPESIEKPKPGAKPKKKPRPRPERIPKPIRSKNLIGGPSALFFSIPNLVRSFNPNSIDSFLRSDPTKFINPSFLILSEIDKNKI